MISQYSFAHNCHFLFLRFKVQALISSPPPDLPQKILRQFLRHAKNLFTNIWLHGVIKNYHPAVIHHHNSTCGLRHSWAESSQAANLDERHAPSYQGVSCLTESLTTAWVGSPSMGLLVSSKHSHNFHFLRSWKEASVMFLTHSLLSINVTLAGHKSVQINDVIMSIHLWLLFYFESERLYLNQKGGIFSLSPSQPPVFSSIQAAHSFAFSGVKNFFQSPTWQVVLVEKDKIRWRTFSSHQPGNVKKRILDIRMGRSISFGGKDGWKDQPPPFWRRSQPSAWARTLLF